jgi:hyperosmotically inducible periplasmic protein
MTKRNIVPAIVVAGSLFIGLGLTASAIDNPKGALSAGESHDVMLNDKVETLLRTDIGLADSRFRVQTNAGVVTVGGSVPDEKSLKRALDLASGIKGVREIRNGMVIDFPK